MYKEVAYDPNTLSEMEYYRLIKQNFGFDKGRYIVASFSDWAKEAMAAVKKSNLRDVERKSITNYLNNLRRKKDPLGHFILPADRAVIPYDNWQEWTASQNCLRHFDLTVSHDHTEQISSLDDLNDENLGWKVPTSIRCVGLLENITEVLAPLVGMSKHLTIIDNYLTVPGNPLLHWLSESQVSLNIEKIRIVTSITNPNPESVYLQELGNLGKKGIQFEWVYLPSSYIHDRYLITDVGAIRSGKGFSPVILKSVESDYLNFNLVAKDEITGVAASLNTYIQDGRATIVFHN